MFKKRASIVDDEDLKDFDSFLNQSESSDEEFSNTKSKAILQQARLQAEISLQKREEEEKGLKAQETRDSYNSDDLDKRLSKYIGTYELPKAKIEEEDEEKDQKAGGSDSEDFEEYKKRLGLNLELEDDEEEERGGNKKTYTDSEGSMRDSRGSLGEIKGYEERWNDSEGESEKEYASKKEIGQEENKKVEKRIGEIKRYQERWNDSEGESEKEYTRQGSRKSEEGEVAKLDREDKQIEKKIEKEIEKEEEISDHESDYEKKIDWESDEGEKSDSSDKKEYPQDTIIKVESTKILPSSYKPSEVKSPKAEIPEQSKPLTFAEFQRRRTENRTLDSAADKHDSPNPAFSSPVVSSPHPDPPPPQPTPRPVLATNFFTPTSPQFSSPTLSLTSPPHSPRNAAHGPMSSPAPRAPLVDPPVSPLPVTENPLALAGNQPLLAGNQLSLAGNPRALSGNPLSLAGNPPSPRPQASALAGNALSLAGNARALTPELKSLDEYEKEYEGGRPGSARPVQGSLQTDAHGGAKANLQNFAQSKVQNRQQDFGRPEMEIESDDDNNSYINNNNNNNNNTNNNNNLNVNMNKNQNQKIANTNYVNNVKTQQQRFDDMQQQYEEQQRLQQENLDRLQHQYKEQQQQLKKLQQSKPSVARSKPSAPSSKPPPKPPAVAFKNQNQNQNVGKFGKPPPPPKSAPVANGKPRSNSLPKPAEPRSTIDEKATHKIIEDSFSKFIQIFQEKAAMATPPRLPTPLNVSQLDTSTHQYPTYVSNDTEWKNKEMQMQREIEELTKENRMLSGSLELKDRKLQEKEEEIGALAQSNAVLSTRLQTSDMREKVKVTGLAALTPEEQRQLQQELKELETLVAGYQKENEKLCADLKTAQQALKAADIRFVKDTQHMQAEIRSLQDAGHPSSGNDREMHVLREQLAIAQRRSAVVEDQAREREAELREQIDKLRKEKRELEAKFGGVDLTQLQKDSTVILTLENKIKSLNAQHKEREDELQKKIQWYVDNQVLLTQNDALIASQKALISDLQAKLEQNSNMQKALPSRANDTKRIRELEKKVAELESKKGGASNIESLISAVNPENDLVNNLKNALSSQSAAHAEREAELDKGLRALRQEYDRMKQQFEKRIKELTATGTKAAPKAADVEAQIQAVRNHYQTKLKELQRKNAMKQKPTKNTPPQPPTQLPTQPPTQPPTHPLIQPTHPPTHSLAQPPTHTHTQSHIPAPRSSSVPPYSSIPSSPPKKAIDHEKAEKIRQLEADLAHKNEEIRVLNYKLLSSNKGDYPPNEIVFSLQQQLATLRIECDTAKMQLQQADIARAAIMENAAAMVKQAQQNNTLQQGEIQLSLARAEGEASALRSRLSHLDAELNTYKDSYRDPIPVVDGLKVRIRSLEDEARALRDEIRTHREDATRMHDEIMRLKDALTNAHVPPGTAQFRQLEAKLMDVEARHKQRESDLQTLLDKTRSTASSEINALRAKYAQIVQKKNEEINTFRAELDHMLQTIATINNVNTDHGVVYFSNVE